MDTPLKPEIVMQNLGPEVKSFIYQAIQEFEPYTTPETTITVTAKNPLSLLKNSGEAAEQLPSKDQLREMYRIEISMSEAGGTVSAEGLNADVYEAVRTAKERLLKILAEIQDDVISNQDRHQQIRHALASNGNGSIH